MTRVDLEWVRMEALAKVVDLDEREGEKRREEIREKVSVFWGSQLGNNVETSSIMDYS